MSDARLIQRLPLVAKRISDALAMGVPAAKVIQLLIQDEQVSWYRGRLLVVRDQLQRGVEVVQATRLIVPTHAYQLFEGVPMGGALGDYMRRVGDWVSWYEQERTELKRALWYPVGLLLMIGIILSVMMGVTIPQIATWVPEPTGVLLLVIGMSKWLQGGGWWVIGLVWVVLGLGAYWGVRRLGAWGKASSQAEALWVLGVQLSMGVSLNTCLTRLARGSVGMQWQQGMQFFEQSGQFSDSIGIFFNLSLFHRERIRYGERTGQLALALLEVANEMRLARRQQLSMRFSRIRPILLGVVGICMAVCMWLTILPVSEIIKNI